MKKNKNDTGLESIKIAGGLLSSSLLTHLRHYQLPGQKPEEYAIEKGLKLSDELGRYWRIARARWQQFVDLQKRNDLDPDTVAVDEWLLPLLSRVLDFQLESSQAIKIGERSFPITHTALNGSVPFVLTGANQPLEAGNPRFGEEGRKRSPAGLLQEYLNAEDHCLWAIVSNGLVLRLLRDNPAMTRPAYVEIDLTRIFEEELYFDFTVFWLLLHATRFAPEEGNPANCILEQWRNQGQTDGERVLGELRYGVTDALRILGTGFVAHPDNTELRKAIKNEALTTEQFFQELLRLIYRFLFLFTTEDRDILLDPKADPAAHKLYEQGYSTTVLRQRSRFRRHYDRYDDGWQQLLITFRGFSKGEPRLAQPALGGLFAPDQCPRLEQARLANRYLYEALFKLCYFENNQVLTRINFRDLDTEELGSVYESLLELIPRLDVGGKWHFGFLGDEADEENTTGHTRKLTGSYYTPDSLVQELIKSALEPVIKKRLAENTGNPREALLKISVCDPACGSGHFLLAAARRLAAELARIDAGTDQPAETNYRHALREVISHCIYGVDINPLAVELCRTALWLEAIEPGKPLGFLDAHIQVGNSLVGVLDPQLLQKGIPQKAFKALSGDDKKITQMLAKRNKANPDQYELFAAQIPQLAACRGKFAAMPEENLEQVEQKREAWLTMMHGEACQDEKLRADLYTAAFFAPKSQDNGANVPTNIELAVLGRGETIEPAMRRAIGKLAGKHRFFHWHLAFPEVIEQGGFDVLLGNPPWERIKLQEKEFFAPRSRDIAEAPNAAIRNRQINALQNGTPAEQALYRSFIRAKHGAEAASSFARESGRFPLTGKGDINLYALFAELFFLAIIKSGRAGILVPTGIATDDSTKAYFAEITGNNRLVSLFDFENREALFKGVHRSYKFCLLTLGQPHKAALLSFFATQPAQLKDQRRCFSLTSDEFSLINPNTRTCPVFRSQQDAELTKKIYRAAPILIKEVMEEKPAVNPWGIKFQAMFHMSNDSRLFRTWQDLQTSGADHTDFLPLYEAKMVHHYDHCWATYETDGTTSRDCTLEEKQNPEYHNLPRYWVDSWQVTLRTANAPKELLAAAKQEDTEVLSKALTLWTAGKALQEGDHHLAEQFLREPQTFFKRNLSAKAQASLDMADQYPLNPREFQKLTKVFQQQGDLWPLAKDLLENRRPKYLLGWRDICRSTDERTVIAGIIPLVAVGDTFLLMFPNIEDKRKVACLVADQNFLVHDFIARQKVGGTHLKFHVKKQITTLAPERYKETDLSFIVPRVLELTYTSHALKPFAQDLGYDGEPFPFDPKRRHQLKCELDAYYAYLYGLTRDELRYILDPADVMGEDYPSETFRILKNKEIKEFGEYRTQRLVLDTWDKLKVSAPDKSTER